MPVVIGPTPNDRVELDDQVMGRRRRLLLDDRSDFVQECLGVLRRWGAEQLIASPAFILAQALSEKVESVLDMGNAGFLL